MAYRKVSELGWKSVAEAVRELGEEKALKALKRGVSDLEYRGDRQAEEKALLKALRKDPKFMERIKNEHRRAS